MSVADEAGGRGAPILGHARFLGAFKAGLGLTFIYWLLASYALRWTSAAGIDSPIWPAAGVALAGLALGGARLWPAIFIGRVLTAYTASRSNALPVVLLISAGNTLAAALPVLLMQRVGRVDLRLATLPDVLWVIAMSLLSALIAATAGTGAFAIGSELSAGPATTWIAWFSGDLAGAITLAPLVFAWARNGLEGLTRRSAVHLALALAFVAAVSWAVFVPRAGTGAWHTWQIFPALVWAALAFQVRGAAIALLIVTSLAAWGVSKGVGPFISPTNGPSTELLIQQFIALTGSTVLLLAAAADERRAKEALRRQKLELETLYREAPVGLALISADRRLLRVNEAMAGLDDLSAEAALGRPLREVLPDFAEPLAPLLERTLSTGAPITNAEVSGTDRAEAGRTRYLVVSLYPVMGEGGVHAVSCVAQEITTRKEAEEREHLLVREIDHRAKNLLAVIQGVVQLTRADNIVDYAAAITGRIQALGRAHSLLSASRWEGVDLKQLAIEELAPFLDGDTSRIRIRGIALQLRPAAAQSLALVLHELATNAAKYGALSVSGGQVEVRWAMTPDRQLEIRWEERHGPPAVAPTRQGFGSTLIRSSIERQLKGRAIFDWEIGGLTCRLTIPAAQLVVSSPAPVIEAPSPPETMHKVPMPGCRVLVVEDEALVAMQIEEALITAGCTVVGPVGQITEALTLADRAPIDAALLDVNVAGNRSFAVADRLAARGVPFAFCTGYDAAILPDRFRDRIVLAKPFSPPGIVATIERLVHSGTG